MPDPEVLLSGGPFRGLNRVVEEGLLTAAESPDTTDCRTVGRKKGKIGKRLGRQRVTTHTYNLLGLGMLNSPFGRYKVTADSNGDWIASAVTWGGVAPPTPTVNVTNASRSSTTATLTVARHGFRVGQTITVAISVTDYNGTFTILTVPDINTFTYTIPASGASGAVTGTVTSNYLSAMSTTATARFVQFKDRLYGCDGADRNQSFDGIRWWPQGILGGVDLPQFTPTITLSGGSSADVVSARLGTPLSANVAELTTAAAHGFSVGQYVTVSISDTVFSGGAASATYVITVVPSATTFRYALAHADVAAETVFGTATVPSSAGALVVSSALSAGVVTIVSAAHGFSSGGGNTVYFTGPFAGKYLDGVTTGPITYISSTSFSFTVAGITAGTITAAPYTTYTYPPGIAPTVFGVGTSTVISGTYYYAVAPANSKRTNAYGRMIEGNPSIVSAVASPSNQSVTIGAIPSTHTDSQVDRWNIYRTLNGGFDTGLVHEQQDFFYLGKVDIGTTTYTDTTADSSGWYLLDDNSNRLRFSQNIPPTCKYMVEYADRLFCAGFDPIVGTCTVAASATVNTFSVTLPTGVKGAYIRFGGDQERYEIKTWIAGSPPTLTLDRTYEGTHTSATPFTIFRNPWEIWFSEENDGDAFGKDGEQRRNMKTLPGERTITGLQKFQGSLIIFTATEIWALYGRGPNRFDIKRMTDPSSTDFGCVSHDTINIVDNTLHFLSLNGPARITSAGTSISVDLYGVPLNVDWLDGLTSTELALSCSGSDGRAVWYSVPVTGQTMNSKTFRWEMDDGSWWEELGCNPKRFIRQDGTDGQLSLLFYLQGKSIVRPAYGTLDLAGSSINSATITSATTTTLTSTGAFGSTNSLAECYVRFYLGGTPTNQLGTLVATRRILSNTADAITWSSDATLPGSGELPVSGGQPTTYDEFEIGNIPWYWTTRTLETPGHLALTQELDVTFEEDE